MITLHSIAAGAGISRLLPHPDSWSWWSGESGGQWIGRAALALDLVGEVTLAQAESLFKDGCDPRTGVPLGRRWLQRTAADSRHSARSGWEMVVCPVKSFSILWALSGEAERRRLEAAEAAAFDLVFHLIEDESALTRTGINGINRTKADGLAAAVFMRRASRSSDPLFHRCVVLYAKVPHDHRWLSLNARPLFFKTVLYSVLYSVELERQMAAELGITAAPRADTIRQGKRPVREYRGVPGPAIAGFSSRRAQTEQHLAAITEEFVHRNGYEPAGTLPYKLAQAATLIDRPDPVDRDPGEERDLWRRRAEDYGIEDPARIVDGARHASALAAAAPTTPVAELPRLVADELARRRTRPASNTIEAETLRQLAATGWHLAAGHDFPALVREITDIVLRESAAAKEQ